MDADILPLMSVNPSDTGNLPFLPRIPWTTSLQGSLLRRGFCTPDRITAPCTSSLTEAISVRSDSNSSMICLVPVMGIRLNLWLCFIKPNIRFVSVVIIYEGHTCHYQTHARIKVHSEIFPSGWCESRIPDPNSKQITIILRPFLLSVDLDCAPTQETSALTLISLSDYESDALKI